MKIATSTTYILLFCFLYSSVTQAQMSTPRGILYGNEWIDYSKEYLKFEVSQDGIYQIKAGTLSANGFDINQPSKLQLWHNGVEIPLYISSGEKAMASTDFIEFVGFKNTIALDTFLYDDWKKDLLNPNYGLFTDISSYYLVMSDQDSGNKRFALTNPDYNDNSIESLPYYRHQSITNFSSSFYKPQIGELKYSHFQPSEGYTTGLRNNVDAPISVNGFVSQGDAPTVRLYLANNNNFPIIKSIKWNNTEVALDSTGSGRTSKINFTVDADKFLNENNLNIKITNNFGLFGLASVEASYNRSFNFANLDFTIANVDSKKRKITSTGLESGINHIYDLQNLQAIKLGENGALIAESGAKLVFGKNATELTIPSKKKFKNITSTDASFLFLTSEKLYDGTTPGNPIDEYAAYRSSSQGGGFKTEILTTQEVYDQFGYGIPNHNWAFKNMSHYLKDHWPSLHYVLIVGKAREYQNVRTPALMANPVNASFMVPTFGTSPSDVLLFSPGRYVNSYFAIGRIAASNIDEVKIYLDKVKQHDIAINAPQEKDKLWLKNIVHLGGGADGGERSSITWFLDRMSDTIQKGAFGANVSAFYKTSTTDIQIANLKAISENINKGASIVTFFGHASIGAFEFNLDNPYNYANEGKYPFIFSLGCYSGNIHSPSRGISEDFLFAKDRGAIAFIASAGTAYLSTQGIYGTKFYAKLTSDFYNQRLGDMFKLFGEKEKDVFTTGEYTLYQQLTFHGDPAVKMHGFEKPDYLIDFSSLKISPNILQINQDSFSLSFNVLNTGKNNKDSINLKIENLSETGSKLFSIKLNIQSPTYEDTIKVKLPILLGSEGKSKIFITIDEEDKIEELSENNNELVDGNGNKGFEIYVGSSEIKPTFPYQHSIYSGKEPLELIATSRNPFNQSSDYVIEIDTTAEFNSPLLINEEFTEHRPMLIWKPNILLTPNTTYYWRTKVKNSSSVWNSSNFTYIPGEEEGFIQRHHYQWLEGNNQGIKHTNKNSWEFETNILPIQVTSEKYTGETPFTTVAASKWGSLTPYEGNINALNVFIWERTKIFPNSETDFGSMKWSNNVFSYDMSSVESRSGLINLLEQAPEDAMIVLYLYMKQNTNDFNVNEWKNDPSSMNIFKLLEEEGAEYFSLIKDEGIKPYIFVYQKGKGKVSEIIGESENSSVSLVINVPTNKNFGTYVSPLIGPIARISKITIDKESPTGENVDTYIQVYGVDKKGNEYIIIDSTSQMYFDSSDLFLSENTDFIKLNFYTKNAGPQNWLGQTPAQLNSWKVIYKPQPDYILSSAKIYSEEFEVGEIIKMDLEILNLSSDTLNEIEYTIEINNEKNKKQIVNKLWNNLAPKVNSHSSYLSLLKESTGLVKVSIDINKDKKLIEKSFENNSATKIINIKKDITNPNIKVLFDGNPILNNDFIREDPTIKIEVKDDNKYFLLDEETKINISLKNLLTGVITNYNSQSGDVKFTPAKDLSKNIATLEINPFLENGEYILEANAIDKFENIAGNNALEIRFIVDSKPKIGKVSNYPNPFSTSTNFIFELTGGIPEHLKLQIFTISGKLVREFDKMELGNIKIGKNYTELTWDGSDSFGNKLANGVYLMKYVCSDSSIKFDDRISDNLTTNGFGKIVLIR